MINRRRKIEAKSKKRSNECLMQSVEPARRFSMMICVSYKMNPHITNRPRYKCACKVYGKCLVTCVIQLCMWWILPGRSIAIGGTSWRGWPRRRYSKSSSVYRPTSRSYRDAPTVPNNWVQWKRRWWPWMRWQRFVGWGRWHGPTVVQWSCRSRNRSQIALIGGCRSSLGHRSSCWVIQPEW